MRWGIAEWLAEPCGVSWWCYRCVLIWPCRTSGGPGLNGTCLRARAWLPPSQPLMTRITRAPTRKKTQRIAKERRTARTQRARLPLLRETPKGVSSGWTAATAPPVETAPRSRTAGTRARPSARRATSCRT
ncbi:hypothetical protein AAFF_G00127520, partial [Aldrovandia affinis]